MSRSVWCWALAGLLLAETAAAVIVFVHAPKEGEPAFGQVAVEIEVHSLEPVAAVEIRLDGRLVAILTEPPWRATVDMGSDNRARTLAVTATDASGEQATQTVVTGTVPIDDAIDLELQQLYVTVTRDGRRVLDLEADRFEIFDDGLPQTRVTFERGNVPLTAALLLDASLSMEGEALAAAIAGASSFVEGMQQLDEAKIMVFSDRLLATTPFTADPSVVGSAMEGVAPSGSTAINDHLYLALAELDARQGRRVIVLLSDGLDVDSVLRMTDVEWKAGRVQSVVYWIRPSTGADLDRQHASVWRDASRQRREIEALRETALGSGGREYVIDRIEEAAPAFAEILQELRDQYVLGYYPKTNRNDGAWHPVEVRVDSPGVEVRVRGGYYDDEF